MSIIIIPDFRHITEIMAFGGGTNYITHRKFCRMRVNAFVLKSRGRSSLKVHGQFDQQQQQQ